MKSVQPSEAQFQNSIIEYLVLRKYKCMRLNAEDHFRIYKGKTYRIRGMEEGVPDILAFNEAVYKGGRIWVVSLIFIEVKRLRKVPTPTQLEKMAELKGYGGKCLVASSVSDLEGAGL